MQGNMAYRVTWNAGQHGIQGDMECRATWSRGLDSGAPETTVAYHNCHIKSHENTASNHHIISPQARVVAKAVAAAL